VKLSLKDLKLSAVTRWGMVATGAMLLVWLGLTLFASGDTRSGPATMDRGKCPSCGRPLSRQAQMSGECPYCAMEEGGKSKRTQGKDAPGTTIPTVLISVLVVLAGVHLFSLYRRRPAAVEEALYYHNCHKCGRKLRYRERQVGNLARCPMCHQLLRFPPIPPRPRPWWQLWKKKQRAQAV
jgi:DNA-directed RNA polymerase subunit RPC12/RpoP